MSVKLKASLLKPSIALAMGKYTAKGIKSKKKSKGGHLYTCRYYNGHLIPNLS